MEKNPFMQRLYRILIFSSTAIIIAAPGLLVLFIVLFGRGALRPALPLPLFLRLNQVMLPVVAILWLLLFPATTIFCLSRLRARWLFMSILQPVLGTLGIIMCCFLSYGALGTSETIRSSAELDQKHYFFTVAQETGEIFTNYRVYRCNVRNMACEVLHEEIGGSIQSQTALLVDTDTHEVHVFLKETTFDRLVYTYGPHPHAYEYIDSIYPGSSHYALNAYDAGAEIGYAIIRCDDENYTEVNCSILPMQFAAPPGSTGELKADESSGEVRFLLDGQLIFSYDKAPHCHVATCVVP